MSEVVYHIIGLIPIGATLWSMCIFATFSGSDNRLCLGQLISPVESVHGSNPCVSCFQEVVGTLKLAGCQPVCVSCVKSHIL